MERCGFSGAMLQCTFGVAPSPFLVFPYHTDMHSTLVPSANIMDNKPMVNIQPFGMCSCLANPVVAAATAAAMGVLTPMPCVPVTAAPWMLDSPPTHLLDGLPALNDSSKCMCAYGGTIAFVPSK